MGVMSSTVTPVIPIPLAGDLTTSSALGQCVVCGKETGKKCSKCSQAGGGLDWMYFCSEEHQKFVSNQLFVLSARLIEVKLTSFLLSFLPS
jgi:hypothetical protein